MKISEVTSYAAYRKAEEEIRAWVEESYPGLSIEFEPHIEVVRTDAKTTVTKRRVRKIVEAVNLKIDEVLEKYAEEIYLSELVERVRGNHPEWEEEIAALRDLKQNKTFLRYMKELHINGFRGEET